MSKKLILIVAANILVLAVYPGGRSLMETSYVKCETENPFAHESGVEAAQKTALRLAVPGTNQDVSQQVPVQEILHPNYAQVNIPKATQLLQVLPCDKLGYSQGNQDCIIDKIFAAIGTTNRFYVEYGFNTNEQCQSSGPNTCRLWKSGLWNGLLLDGSHRNETINLHAHYLYANNMVSILEKYSVPKELDFYSGDMDSHDYFVMKSVLDSGKFRPRVISAEYNSNWPLGWKVSQVDPTISHPDHPTPPFKFQGCIWGASADSLRYLMEKHGYSLVAVTHVLDVFYVRNDVLLEAGYHAPAYEELIKPFVGHQLHPTQQNPTFLSNLVDVQVYEETQNYRLANRAMVQRILAHVKSPTEVTMPCLAGIKATDIEDYLQQQPIIGSHFVS